MPAQIILPVKVELEHVTQICLAQSASTFQVHSFVLTMNSLPPPIKFIN